MLTLPSVTKKIKVYFLSDKSQEKIISRSKQFQSVVTELKTSLRTQKSEYKFHNYKIGGNVKKKRSKCKSHQLVRQEILLEVPSKLFSQMDFLFHH